MTRRCGGCNEETHIHDRDSSCSRGHVGCAVYAQQQQVALTVTVNNNGQPASGVEVVLELANKNKVASVTTRSDGNASLAVNPLDLANMGKVDVEVTVEQECPDGQTHVTVTVPGQEPEDKGCRSARKCLHSFYSGAKVNA